MSAKKKARKHVAKAIELLDQAEDQLTEASDILWEVSDFGDRPKLYGRIDAASGLVYDLKEVLRTL